MTNHGRARDQRGSILVLSTVGVVIAMIAAALAVDLGFLAQEARTAQKVADLAALDAARVLPADYNAAAQASASRNRFPTTGVTAVEGVKVDGKCQAQPGAGTVCVTATSPHKNAFPFVGGASSLSRTAVAGSGNPIGTVRVGSKVASADGSITPMQVVLLNRTIGSLIGGSYSTDIVGWKGLVGGNVTFAALTSELAAVTGNSTFNVGTADQVLQSTFTADQLFTAMANALHNSGDTADVSIANSVQDIGANVNGAALNAPLKLYDLFDFGSVVVGNKQDVANATLNVLELIRGGAILADGDHFASFELAAADVVGGAIPGGFSKVKVSMGLIEAPRTSFPGPAGKDLLGNYYTSAETSQIRVKVDVSVKIPLTSALTAGLGLASVTLLPTGSLVEATFSYYLEAGSAHAYLDAIQCATLAEPASVDVLGVTDVSTSKLGLVTDAALRNTATAPVPTTQTVLSIAGILNVRTTGVVTTNIPGNAGITRTFTPPYTADSASQPVPGTMLSLPNLATANLTVDPLLALLNTGTLLSDLVTGINATGLTFSSGTPGLTTSILKPLYDAIGLSFGGADLWAPPVQTCSALSPLGLPVASNAPPVLRG